MKKDDFDIFLGNKIYPSAASIFKTLIKPINDVKDDCVYVLDTNALLVPYSTGSQSLAEIKKVLEKLKNEQRLKIPGQVAREFASNRPEKLKEIFQQLNRKQQGIQPFTIGRYPLLEENEAFKAAAAAEKEINEKLAHYRKLIGSVIAQTKDWLWNDPVSLIYSQLFSEDTIYDLKLDRELLTAELQYRYLHKIPPGFKDGGKDDDGIGDLLIWYTILEIGKTSKNIVFVSGEEKPDWFHRSEKQILYPRFELVNEFNVASGGHSFHVIKLSELLQLQGADSNTVKEVEIEEKIIVNELSTLQNFGRIAESAVSNWLIQENYEYVNQNEIGFPDFEIGHFDGSKLGAEVITIDARRGRLSLIPRLKDRLYRSYYLINEGVISKMLFFVVANSYDVDFRSLKAEAARSGSGFDPSLFEFKFGYLDDYGNFVDTQLT